MVRYIMSQLPAVMGMIETQRNSKQPIVLVTKTSGAPDYTVGVSCVSTVHELPNMFNRSCKREIESIAQRISDMDVENNIAVLSVSPKRHTLHVFPIKQLYEAFRPTFYQQQQQKQRQQQQQQDDARMHDFHVLADLAVERSMHPISPMSSPNHTEVHC